MRAYIDFGSLVGRKERASANSMQAVAELRGAIACNGGVVVNERLEAADFSFLGQLVVRYGSRGIVRCGLSI